MLSEQRLIASEEDEGKRLKDIRLTVKMEKLRRILFVDEEEPVIDETEQVPLIEYMELKEEMENMLLEAHDEIVQLKQVVRTSDEKEQQENLLKVDADYKSMNGLLNELAILREIRRNITY